MAAAKPPQLGPIAPSSDGWNREEDTVWEVVRTTVERLKMQPLGLREERKRPSTHNGWTDSPNPAGLLSEPIAEVGASAEL